MEASVVYWLSRYGFKCAGVERNGVDFLARNLQTNELLGISVRSVPKSESTEHQRIHIPLEDLDKARTACLGFGCTPHFALHVAQLNEMWLFIVSMEHLVSISLRTQYSIECSVAQREIDRFLTDPQIICIETNHKVWRWWA